MKACNDGVDGCIPSFANAAAGPNWPEEFSGAGGIIVDNNRSSGQVRSIYFSTECSPFNCF